MAYAWQNDFDELEALLERRGPAGKIVGTSPTEPGMNDPFAGTSQSMGSSSLKSKQSEAIAKIQAQEDEPNVRPGIQSEPVIHIESTPLSSGKIVPTDSVPSSPIGGFKLENYNRNLKQMENDFDLIGNQAKAALSDEESLKNMRMKMLANQLARVNEAAPEYKKPDISSQDLLKSMQSEKKDEPQDLATQLITAFGPGILGLATGGNAGYDAAGQTKKYANEVQQKAMDRAAKEKQIRAQIEGKKLSGIADIGKAQSALENTDFDNKIAAQKLKDEQLKAAYENLKDMHDKGMIKTKDFTTIVNNMYSKEADMTQKGIESIGNTEEKILDRESNLKKAKESAKARPARPPTEFNYKSASNYSQAEGAERAYQQIVKDSKGRPPALDSEFYTKFKSLAENTEGTTLLGTLLKQVPDPMLQRQIQAEMDFIGPVLRQKSGAAVTVGEWLADGETYFPRKNNDAVGMAAKDASRKRALAGLKNSIGTAPLPPTINPAPVIKEKPTPPPDKNIKKVGDKTYKKVNGGWQEQ